MTMELVVDGARSVIGTALPDLEVFVDNLQRDGKLVKAVYVNGQNVLLKDLYRGAYADDTEVLIETYASVNELIEDTMESYKRLLPHLLGAIESSISALDTLTYAEGVTWFQNALPTLNWHIAVLGNFANMAPSKDVYVCQIYERTKAAYEAVTEAVVNLDFVGLRDLLAYELHPLLLSWNQGVEVFERQMRLERVKAGLNFGAGHEA